MANRRLPAEAISALSFPRQQFPSVYLHPERVLDAFTGNIGAIEGFIQSAERSGQLSGTIGLPGIELGGERGGSSGTSVEYNLRNDILAQALVLRAYLANNKLLTGDSRRAQIFSYVLARGPGGVRYIDHTTGRPGGIIGQLPAEVGSEVLAEYERRIRIERADDRNPAYWPAISSTPTGRVIAFLGENELNQSNAVNYFDLPVTCCIFGTKIRDWPDWTMVSPLHVWLEPTDE